MLDLIKKAMLVGVGAFDLISEKIEKVAEELVKRGEMAEGERAKFVKEMTDKVIKDAGELKEKIGSKAKETISTIKGSKAEEVEELKQRIAQLEERLKDLEGKEGA